MYIYILYMYILYICIYYIYMYILYICILYIYVYYIYIYICIYYIIYIGIYVKYPIAHSHDDCFMSLYHSPITCSQSWNIPTSQVSGLAHKPNLSTSKNLIFLVVPCIIYPCEIYVKQPNTCFHYSYFISFQLIPKSTHILSRTNHHLTP